MKKIILLMCICLSCTAAWADDADFWDEPVQIDRDAKSQEKTVTNAEFEKVLNFFQKKKKEKEEKKKKKMGAPANPDIENQSDMSILSNLYDSYPTLMVPVTMITNDGQEIPPGYYRVMSVKKTNEFFINFYQGNSLIARVRSYETTNDYKSETLNYVKIIPNSNNTAQIVYGDLDCNLETTVNLQ